MSSLIDKLLNKYASQWKFLIRPPRQFYSKESLGPQIQLICEKEVQRIDLEITNRKNQYLQGSLFETKTPGKKTCVIYLHGNNGCRLEAITYLQEIVKRNMSLFCFDFSGAGTFNIYIMVYLIGSSEGDYITLGVEEQYDIEAVINLLNETKKFDSFVLWGRSMGAVTSIMYTANLWKKENIPLKCIIVDSPYYSIKKVVEDTASSKLKIPSLFLAPLFSLIGNKIEKMCGTNVLKINILNEIETVGKTGLPVFFCMAKGDNVVNNYHVETLYKKFGSKQKTLSVFEGQHNSLRPKTLVNEIFQFLTFHTRNESNRKNIFACRINTHKLDEEKIQSKKNLSVDIYSSEKKITTKERKDCTPNFSVSAIKLKKSIGYQENKKKEDVKLSLEERGVKKVDIQLLSNPLKNCNSMIKTKENFGKKIDQNTDEYTSVPIAKCNKISRSKHGENLNKSVTTQKENRKIFQNSQQFLFKYAVMATRKNNV